MHSRLALAILPQPDDTTCGPTCLHAVYRFYKDETNLAEVIREIKRLEHGGTYAVYLGLHALRRGYQCRLYTYNLRVFDPTWFSLSRDGLRERLELRRKSKVQSKHAVAHSAYAEFLDAGGEVLFQDLTRDLIRRFLNRGTPILTGLSSTYLYKAMRERPNGDDDDVTGEPGGHFVVLCGYDRENRTVLVADPLHPNPAFQGLEYLVDIDRLVCSILLGILTHDADLLIIEPKRASGAGGWAADAEHPLLFPRMSEPANAVRPSRADPDRPGGGVIGGGGAAGGSE